MLKPITRDYKKISDSYRVKVPTYVKVVVWGYKVRNLWVKQGNLVSQQIVL
jgi:hypothetical protein